MATEIPLAQSQHVGDNTVILLRLTPVLKATKPNVTTDVFEIKLVNKWQTLIPGHNAETQENAEPGLYSCFISRKKIINLLFYRLITVKITIPLLVPSVSLYGVPSTLPCYILINHRNYLFL